MCDPGEVHNPACKLGLGVSLKKIHPWLSSQVSAGVSLSPERIFEALFG